MPCPKTREARPPSRPVSPLAAAVARRLLCVLYAMLRTSTRYKVITN
jgi:hypothetical protein